MRVYYLHTKNEHNKIHAEKFKYRNVSKTENIGIFMCKFEERRKQILKFDNSYPFKYSSRQFEDTEHDILNDLNLQIIF